MKASLVRGRSRLPAALLIALASPAAATAADLTEAVREARAAFDEFRPVYFAYAARADLAGRVRAASAELINLKQDVRARELNVHQMPRPVRMNSIQKAYYGDFKARQQHLNSFASDLTRLKRELAALDEEAQSHGLGALIKNPRKFEEEVRRLGRRCNETFAAMKGAAGPAAADSGKRGTKTTKVVREAMRAMSPGEFGPAGPFLEVADAYLLKGVKPFVELPGGRFR